MDFNKPVRASFTFEDFKKRGKYQPDGWGVAFYTDNHVKVYKKAEMLTAETPVEDELKPSKIYLAHIRRSSGTVRSEANTHPFQQKYDNRDWIFAHNGALDVEGLQTGEFRPLGETDSERAFCYLLNEMKREKRTLRTPEDFGWLLGRFRELNTRSSSSSINCLMSDGERLFCYRDINGYHSVRDDNFSKKVGDFGLKYTLRKPPYEGRNIKDEDYKEIDLGLNKGSDERGYLVASTELTNEEWTSLRKGQLMVFRDGEIIYASKENA
jgi:glutamine amidotransferase